MNKPLPHIKNMRLNLAMVKGIKDLLMKEDSFVAVKEGKFITIPNDKKKCKTPIEVYVGFTHINFKENSGLMNHCFDGGKESSDGKKITHRVEFENIDPNDTKNRKPQIIDKVMETEFGKFSKRWSRHYKDDDGIICHYTDELLEILNPNMEVEFLYFGFTGALPLGLDGDGFIDIPFKTHYRVHLLPIQDFKRMESYLSMFLRNSVQSKYNLAFLNSRLYHRLFFLNALTYFKNGSYLVEYKNQIGDEFKFRFKTLIDVEIELTIHNNEVCFVITFRFESSPEINVYVPVDDMDEDGKPKLILEISPVSFQYDYDGTVLKFEKPNCQCDISEHPITLADFLISIDPPKKELSYCSLFIGKYPSFIIDNPAFPLVQKCHYLDIESGNKCCYIDGRTLCIFFDKKYINDMKKGRNV